MQSFSLEGITLEIPDSWYGRLFVDDTPDVGDAIPYPTGHFATFPLPPFESTGSFGSGATALMSSSDIFVALLEYVVDETLQAGTGLFSSQGIPTSLTAQQFSSNVLEVRRPNQVGYQQFFTASERPFCLYVVMGDVTFGAAQLAALAAILSSVSIMPRTAASAVAG